MAIAYNTTPPLVMRWPLIEWLNSLPVRNYALNISDQNWSLTENDPPVYEAVLIFSYHATIPITADGTPLLPVPNVGQRGAINAYSLVSGNVLNVTGNCDTFKLWLNNQDVTPLDNTWDGTFEETIPGIYVLEGRKNLASGFIIIEVTA